MDFMYAYQMYGEGLCRTRPEPCPWIAIDYGTSVDIRRVEIFCGSRPKNVNVRISDELPTSGKEMFKGGNLLGNFTGYGTDGQLITISGQL